jgi:SAM-dependent methyltransferase
VPSASPPSLLQRARQRGRPVPPGARRNGFLLLRRLRDVALHGAAVVDGMALRLNGKHPFPPIYYRRDIGSLHSVEMTAGEFAALIAVLGHGTRSSHIVDVGCGPGMLVFMLEPRIGASGRYVGLDVSERMVRWAERNLGNDRFSFRHHDYWNATYNPSGQRFLPFAVDDGWADVLLMKSVISHMLPEDAAFYIAETARMLAPGGTALVSAYVYGNDDDATVDDKFPYEDGDYRYARSASPESGIALSWSWLSKAIDEAGLEVELRSGSWKRDTHEITTHQDLLVLTRRT